MQAGNSDHADKLKAAAIIAEKLGWMPCERGIFIRYVYEDGMYYLPMYQKRLTESEFKAIRGTGIIFIDGKQFNDPYETANCVI